MTKLAIAVFTVALLAGCANENNAIPLDRDTWTTRTDARGNPYDEEDGLGFVAATPSRAELLN